MTPTASGLGLGLGLGFGLGLGLGLGLFHGREGEGAWAHPALQEGDVSPPLWPRK